MLDTTDEKEIKKIKRMKLQYIGSMIAGICFFIVALDNKRDGFSMALSALLLSLSLNFHMTIIIEGLKKRIEKLENK